MDDNDEYDYKKDEQKHVRGKMWSSTKILHFVAYVAVICIAISLMFRLIFKNSVPSVADAFASVGECLAYILCIWLSFYWVMRQYKGEWTKHNLPWLIAWIVATVFIVIIYIVGLV